MFIKGTSGVSSHPKLHTYEEGYLLPVLHYDELLFGQRHKGLLRQIHDLAELSAEDFDRSYAKLIQHFMEFVQVLPHETSGIIGSLLNYSLARAVAVFQKYCQVRKGHLTPLLRFAVFSAALLKDVGRVLSNQRVVMVDETGEFHRDWNPLSGSMIGQTDFYKLYPISASYLRLESEVAPLLARQLIPHDVFLWLSSDLPIFADWLAALLGEEGAASKEITWALALIKREDIIAILNSLDTPLIEGQIPAATEHGEAFYQWIKQGIERGDIAVNTDDASVHVVNEGVLIEQKLFKQFADMSKSPVNFAVVFTQFGNLMGIASKGGSDYLHAAYFSPSESNTSFTTFSGTMGHKTRSGPREGVVVNSDAIFIHKENPGVSGLKSSKPMSPAQQQFSIQAIAANALLSSSRRG